MKKLLVGLLTFGSLSAFSSDVIEFSGIVKNSQFEKLNGRECSIVLVKTEAQGAQKIAYIAHPKIKGVSSFFNRRKAPLKMMYINDLTAQNDTHSVNRENVLVGLGIKYRGEISQRLYVDFNNNMDEVVSWQYRDGTRTGLGYTYTCE